MAQNGKKSLSCFISQKPYTIWLSFEVHKCRMVMSPDVFYIFKTLIFWVVSGVKGKKNGPKWQIILSVALHISGTIHHMIFINGTHGENDKSSDFFTIFSKFGFFELLGGSKSTKWPIMAKNSVMSYISGTIHHIIFIYGTQV